VRRRCSQLCSNSLSLAVAACIANKGSQKSHALVQTPSHLKIVNFAVSTSSSLSEHWPHTGGRHFGARVQPGDAPKSDCGSP
jgi:hypothetical protein